MWKRASKERRTSESADERDSRKRLTAESPAQVDLAVALADGTLEEVETVIRQGRCDLNRLTFGHTRPLHDALERSDAIDAVALLLRYGADPNLLDAGGEAPLHRLAADPGGGSRAVDTAHVLIAAGARLDVHTATNIEQTFGYELTPLHVASQIGFNDMADLLVRSGATIDATARLGLRHGTVPRSTTDQVYTPGATPLHFAAWRKELNVGRLLLAAGANPSARTSHGLTPLDIVRQETRFYAQQPPHFDPRAAGLAACAQFEALLGEYDNAQR